MECLGPIWLSLSENIMAKNPLYKHHVTGALTEGGETERLTCGIIFKEESLKAEVQDLKLSFSIIQTTGA